jgi:hypothetical protein
MKYIYTKRRLNGVVEWRWGHGYLGAPVAIQEQQHSRVLIHLRAPLRLPLPLVV